MLSATAQLVYTLVAISAAVWSTLRAHRWRVSANAWRTEALRHKRSPALTIVAPAYHAPREQSVVLAE